MVSVAVEQQEGAVTENCKLYKIELWYAVILRLDWCVSAHKRSSTGFRSLGGTTGRCAAANPPTSGTSPSACMPFGGALHANALLALLCTNILPPLRHPPSPVQTFCLTVHGHCGPHIPYQA